MARRYFRRRAARPVRSRTTRRYRSSGRRTRTRRVYRRRVGRMSTRAILNKTSDKKRDTMLPYTNIPTFSSNVGQTTYTSGAAVLQGSRFYIFPFCPTARAMNVDVTGLNSEAQRKKTLCFARGYKETVRIATNDGMPWTWRRIVFQWKGDRFWDMSNTTAGTTQQWALYTSSGYVRVVNSVASGDQFQTTMFRGGRNADWTDEMIAPTDTRNCQIMYDKTRQIFGGNEEGTQRTYQLWHPLNKNIKYRDEEFGGSEDSSYQADPGRQGLGDVFVVDMFSARIGATSSSQLNFEPQGTYYWHEK